MTVSGFTIEHNWCANKAASNSSPPPGSPPWCGNTRARADGVNLCFLQYSMHPNSMSPPNNTDESGAPVTRIAALSEFEVKRLPPRSLPPTPPSAMEAGGYSTSIDAPFLENFVLVVRLGTIFVFARNSASL